MRATIAFDGNLLARARVPTGIQGTSRLARDALKALIEREGACRVGGADPAPEAPPRPSDPGRHP
ncbi:type II toxin-antitoxin system VapB family antitoxin [Paracraurococcus ruber]|uniref:Type II toxin-antitoxin system VapB family antitoxin n=1 Tax=Paracraurococcus ruber TaxID=77675 RepID=A0ABS1D436_9PROT|nr:hypothetical protein [Paracraurococcus ruber]TDG32963.1 type II toxin-antitoxin system VapB family antitoxin [Paracraurococcus ruber]